MRGAVSGGHLHVLDWLYEICKGGYMAEDIIYYTNKSAEVRKWFENHGYDTR